MDEYPADDVSDVHDAEGQKDALDDLVRPPGNDGIHEDGGADNHPDLEQPRIDKRNVAAEYRRDRRDAGKLGGGIAEIGNHEEDENPERHLDAEVLADQIGESLPGYGAHARAHLLCDDERERDRNEQPEERVAELRARLRVRQN